MTPEILNLVEKFLADLEEASCTAQELQEISLKLNSLAFELKREVRH